jgi:arylformamidase
MEIYDISVALNARLAPWPGDVPFGYALGATLAEGASVNLGSATMSLHSGTHADAPFHYQENGATIDVLALDAFFGPALVIDLSRDLESERIGNLQEFENEIIDAPRVLLKTNCWKDRESFPATIPTIAPETARWLGDKGVKLLGLDLPSVDQIESRDLPVHHALGSARIQILESLDLSRL